VDPGVCFRARRSGDRRREAGRRSTWRGASCTSRARSREFGAFVEEVASALEDEEDDVQARLDAEAILRARYPATVLSRKEPLAALAEEDPITWYVYRDGRLIPSAVER
jgi:hypothetical protein